MAEKENFKFEVLDRDGKILMVAESKTAMEDYDTQTLKSMIAAGYKFKLNGKVYKPKLS